MGKRQHITEGCKVFVSGFEMITSKLREYVIDGRPTIRFTGTLTDDPRNDAIRGTGYDGGVYGGNDLIYTWELP